MSRKNNNIKSNIKSIVEREAKGKSINRGISIIDKDNRKREKGKKQKRKDKEQKAKEKQQISIEDLPIEKVPEPPPQSLPEMEGNDLAKGLDL